MLSRAKAAASRHAQSRDRDTYVQPSPPLSDDVYAEPIPEPVQTLIAYLQQAGPRTPELFGGDPSVRAINDLLDGLAAEPSPSVERLARGDARLAAAALAAYVRHLPHPLVLHEVNDALRGAVDLESYAERVATARDVVAELPESNVAVLHRLVDFLLKLSERSTVGGNSLQDLAAFWADMLLPQPAPGAAHGAHGAAHRVKDFRVVALMLQQGACIFQGSLDTVELAELPLPPHLAAEARQHGERAKQWKRVKGSLLRDSRGQFKIVVKEDGSGIYISTLAPTDMHDDRDKFREYDYLVTMNRQPVAEMSLAAVKEKIRVAGSMLELEVRRYSPHEAEDAGREEAERKRQREQQQLQRYQAQMQEYVAKPPPVANEEPTEIGVGAAPGANGGGAGGVARVQCRVDAPTQPAAPSSGTADLLGLDLLAGAPPPSAAAGFGDGGGFGAGGFGGPSFVPPAVATAPALGVRSGGSPSLMAGSSSPAAGSLFPSAAADPFAAAAAAAPTTTPALDAGLFGGDAPAASGGAPQLQLLLTADVGALRRQREVNAFSARFSRELASLLGVDAARVEVVDLQMRPPTQVLVEFELADGGAAEPTPAALVDALDALVGAPGSALRRHALFRSVDASVALVAAPASGGAAAPPAAKLDDAFAAPPPFRVGDAVLYALRDGSQRPATVVKVHTDDETPYYTVSVDGQERGTERSRLTPAGSGGGGGGLGGAGAGGGGGGGWVSFDAPPPGAKAAAAPSLQREAEEARQQREEARQQREAEERAAEEARQRESKYAEYRGLSREEKRAKIREKLQQEHRAKREAEEKARKEAEEAAKREREEKAKREAEEKARKEAERKRREEEYRQQVREKIKAEQKAKREAEEAAKREAEERARREKEERERQEAEELARREAEERARVEAEERARREAEATAALGAALEKDAIEALEEALALAARSGVAELEAAEEARARLKVLLEARLKEEAERTRATIALEAAMEQADVELLESAIGAARAAGVEASLVAAAETRAEVVAAERAAAEEAAEAARREAEERARVQAAASERLAAATDGESMDELAAALEQAAAAGLTGHAVWMAERALQNLEEAAARREAEYDAAVCALEVAMEEGHGATLVAALDEAREAGVEEELLAEGEARLEEVRAEEAAAATAAALEAVREAAEADDLPGLEVALAAAAELGAAAEDLAEGHEALAEMSARRAAEEAERKEAAGALQSLIVSRLAEAEALRQAVDRARRAGVAEALVERALEKLEPLEEEEERRLEAEEAARVEAEEAARAEEEEEAREEAEAAAAREAEERAAREAEEAEEAERQEEEERARAEVEERERFAAEEAAREAAAEAAERDAEEAARRELAEEARIEAEERERAKAEAAAAAAAPAALRNGNGSAAAHAARTPAADSPRPPSDDADEVAPPSEPPSSDYYSDSGEEEAAAPAAPAAAGALRARLRRDAKGQFKIVVKQDGGGIYLSTLAPTDAHDDRQSLRVHDYLLRIGGEPVAEMSLAAVKETIRVAGPVLELEVARPEGAPDAGFAAFDAAFDGEFAPTPAAAGPSPSAAPSGEAEAAFASMQRLCAESQRAQAELLVCCDAYRGELAEIDAGLRRRGGSAAPEGGGGGGGDARIAALEEENRMLKAGFLEAQAALTRSEEELAQAEEQNAILAKNLADAFTELHRR